MAQVVLIIGGNEGDIDRNLRLAEQMIAESVGCVEAESSVWVSAPWGDVTGECGGPAGDFKNKVLALRTSLSPHQVLEQTKRIENALGRKRSGERTSDPCQPRKYLSRTMDIDILLYDEQIVESLDLRIPHPLMAEREFVLDPLCEVFPDAVHPISGRTVRSLRQELKTRCKR